LLTLFSTFPSAFSLKLRPYWGENRKKSCFPPGTSRFSLKTQKGKALAMILHGAPVRLHVLDFGLFQVNAGREIGIPGFLVTTDCGERVLVDTGFPAKYAADPKRAAQEDGLTAFGHIRHLTETNLCAGQLALVGLTPADVDLVILTHSHIDHIGGLNTVAHAPIIIGIEERALPRPLYWGDCQPMQWPVARWLPVHEDTDIGPGLTVLHVPGHAPGQLALRIDLPHTGRVVITSDAISRPSEPDEGFAGAHDPALAAIHAARLLAMSDGALMLWGHCPTQWPDQRKAPDYYD
jgi:N-acyl homoserine lactone hydrolase